MDTNLIVFIIGLVLLIKWFVDLSFLAERTVKNNREFILKHGLIASMRRGMIFYFTYGLLFLIAFLEASISILWAVLTIIFILVSIMLLLSIIQSKYGENEGGFEFFRKNEHEPLSPELLANAISKKRKLSIIPAIIFMLWFFSWRSQFY